MGVFGDIKTSKNIKNYECKSCDFKCCKLGDWNRHITTSKHSQLTLANAIGDNSDIKKYTCDICSKIYNSRNGLWKHKKVCQNIIKEDIIKEDIIKEHDTTNFISEITPEMIMNILKQTTDLQNMVIAQNNTILELSKHNSITNNSHITNLHNTNNSHNKTFNLQFFLNETCKDAMNIMDFVDSIKLQLSDLEKVGELGYVDGISNIIVKNLNALDITQRPVHCTDKKREVLYVKDENKWEKEDEEKNKIHKVIKRVALKNQRMIPKFKEEHPDCGKSTSKFSDQYNKIIMEAMGGLGDNDKEKEERIVKKISKEVYIDKTSDTT